MCVNIWNAGSAVGKVGHFPKSAKGGVRQEKVPETPENVLERMSQMFVWSALPRVESEDEQLFLYGTVTPVQLRYHRIEQQCEQVGVQVFF